MKSAFGFSNVIVTLCLLLTLGASPADALAQTSNRPRVSKPTPTPARSPAPTPNPNPTTKLPDVSPQPCAPTGTGCDPRLPRILSEIRPKIDTILNNPLLARGRIGVKIEWIGKDAVIYSHNSDKYFMPASNMKSYTVAAALEALTPNFRFVTGVYSVSKPDSNGILLGDLVVYGRGDPSISSSFFDGDDYKGIDALAERIVEAGVKQINGSIIGDETYFTTEPIPYGWEWDDLQWYYGAEISPLSINDNSVRLRILPGSPGMACAVDISPVNRQFRVINNCLTMPGESRRQIRVRKKLDENVVEIAGTMPEKDTGYVGNITVSRPANIFLEILKQRLQLKGVMVKGQTRAVNLDERNGIRFSTANLTEIASLESPPLGLIAEKTMKPSQNLYTELILRVLGEERGDKTDLEKTSAQKGIEVVQKLLRKAGAEPESVVQYDGSGLSRHNLITPDSAVSLYTYMNRSAHALMWRNSLTVGGVDGTLKNRFKGTSAEANARGKTGTIDQVSALSGYVTAKSGEAFVFSILTNNIPNSRLRVNTIDEIVVLLANLDTRENAK